MRIIGAGLLAILFFNQCKRENAKRPVSRLHIICYDFQDTSFVNALKPLISAHYPCHVANMSYSEMPKMAYYKERDRYRADSMICYMSRNRAPGIDITLGLTSHDISTTKGDIPDYGIFGLGFSPGTSCIVSKYRLSANISEKTVRERFLKIVLHELGHNFGLSHCKHSKSCYMQDAEGSIKTIDHSGYDLCDSCNVRLNTQLNL